MTRINLIDPSLLTDQHLLAEHRETTRIPNTIKSGKAKVDKVSLAKTPYKYTLGTGHIKYFYRKLSWLKKRYEDVTEECIRRGFNVKNIWPEGLEQDFPHLFLDRDVVTEESLKINVERVLLRFPKSARMRGDRVTFDEYLEVLDGKCV
ncbi:putative deoxyribonuclease [Nitrincola phage 1M3-16]|uniref:endonuclease V N-glycosylase UV repair enzyme n=1 Tax=Nitrincola phage 1M3-16 TaxID=1472912 RepID=UPI000444C692|nr:endonuclease V N-glycosylase UV repair enzyme [Nitrincola phage 1M3-16]AHX01077.1 putative deoxyribonuclease [Nitrincola phage 1M3-16]